MRTALRLAALGVAVVTLALWFFSGPNFGWTKTSVMRESVEEATGLPHITWERTFLPGVDFLAAGLLGAIVLGGASFLARKK